MRRPAKTKKQRDYDHVQSVLLRLRRAAVRWSHRKDSDGTDDDSIVFLLTDLQAACDAYTAALPAGELKRLLK